MNGRYDEDDEDEDEGVQENEGVTSSHESTDATDLLPRPSPLDSTISVVDPNTKAPPFPLPLLPSLEPTPPTSPPRIASSQTSTQNQPLVDPTPSPSNISSLPRLTTSSLDNSSLLLTSDQPHPSTDPDVDGELERRERRLLSILPLPGDDEVEESSRSSKVADAGVGSSGVGKLDRFWDDCVFLFELD